MLSICVPVRDTVTSEFAYCLAQLTANLSNQNVPFMLFFELGSMLPQQRINLAKKSIEANATQILWLDSDMSFPSSVYHLLNKHKKDIVACTYSTRTPPHKSVAFTNKFDLSNRLEATTGLHKVYSVGMGCMLVNASVFNKLTAPWFEFKYSPRYDHFKGEDIYFCELASDAGYDVYVDADASKYCSHTGQQNFTLEDTK